jgi:hypothetical protein
VLHRVTIQIVASAKMITHGGKLRRAKAALSCGMKIPANSRGISGGSVKSEGKSASRNMLNGIM